MTKKTNQRAAQFFKNVYSGEKAALTTGRKADRAAAWLSLVGMAASIAAPGLGLAIIGISSAIQFGEGAYNYTHGNKKQGSSEMGWAAGGLALGALGGGAMAAEARGAMTAARIAGGVSLAGGVAMSAASIGVGVKQHNDLMIFGVRWGWGRRLVWEAFRRIEI